MATGIDAQTIEPVNPSEPEANKLFRMVMKHKGSDLHLKVGVSPAMRLTGVLRQMQLPPLSTADMERLMFPLLTARQKTILEEEGGVDFAHIVTDPDGLETRFRVNLFRQRGKLSLVARRVNNQVPDFEGLGLPPVLADIASHDQGIVILAGVTGSGKSTTIASMLEYVNARERCNIVTIEDPIEFTFVDKKSIVHQREVGIDVIDWDTALKHAVRQDPDIILVGEMRDRETFNAAMHAAETGHLVFGTIHASSAPSTVGRILDLFPRDMHPALRQSMAFNLQAIIAQKLLPTAKDWAEKTGQTRIPTCEIMRTSPTVRKLILNEEDGKLGDAIRIGKEDGMQDFTESLKQLVQAEKVERATAFEVAPSPEALKMALKGITIAQPGIL
ncbi:type IV pilus twitching motility protein PilT [Tautonia rosea]|uniref:type IV pilus twitching motility protein PilT n=1 Tax=Tautonia rosea TaxID=2728037 RepID=UPI0014758A7B|nr:PilT/PilU family type 4a pilus ATPase [Tautonia rosea]